MKSGAPGSDQRLTWTDNLQSTMNSDAQQVDLPEEELFYSEFEWFIGHVTSLAMDAQSCCADQGHFNVAHELFYFLTAPGRLIDDPRAILTAAQKEQIQLLVNLVAAIPEEARCWATADSESLANMQHAAWNNAREQAKVVLDALAPISIKMDEYYSRSATQN